MLRDRAPISTRKSAATVPQALTALAALIATILPALVIAARAGPLVRRHLRMPHTWVDEESIRATREPERPVSSGPDHRATSITNR